jgi:hypothetical protein
MTVEGRNEWGQFPPYVGEYDVLATFNEVEKHFSEQIAYFAAIYKKN